jgi:hypothetical protein
MKSRNEEGKNTFPWQRTTNHKILSIRVRWIAKIKDEDFTARASL